MNERAEESERQRYKEQERKRDQRQLKRGMHSSSTANQLARLKPFLW